MLTKTLAEKRRLLLLPKPLQRQADFANLCKQTTNKAEATKQSQSKPLQTKTPAKSLEADFSDSTKLT